MLRKRCLQVEKKSPAAGWSGLLVPMCAWLTILLVAGGCQTRHEVEVASKDPIRIDMNVRVDIYDHAQVIEQIVSGDRPPEFEDGPAQGSGAAPAGGRSDRPGTRQEGRHLRSDLLRVAAADGEEPEVTEEEFQKAVLARRQRFQKILSLKEKELVGENRWGLLTARRNLDSEQRTLFNHENRDRLIIYRYEAQRKEVSLKAVQAIFAKVQREQAKPGTWIEIPEKDAEEGWRWVKKQ